MRIKIERLLALVLLILSSAAFGQNATENLVKGVIRDDNGAFLQSITVTEKGTTNAVVTNGHGSYAIRVKPTAVLVFTGVGFERQEVAVSGNNQVNVTLGTDAKALSGVVVVGYGTQKKVNLTGSVAVVKG